MIVDIHTRVWHKSEQLGEAIHRQLRRTRREPWQSIDPSATALILATEPVEAAVVHGMTSLRLGASISAVDVQDVIKREPAKLLGFAGVDPNDPDRMRRLQEAIDLGMVGINLSPTLQGFHPSATYALEVFEFCEAHDLSIMIETHGELARQAAMEFANPALLDEPLRMFPGLHVCLKALGHPYIDQSLTMVAKHPNLYADISSLTQRPWELYNALITAHQRSVTDRLLFASGFPFAQPQDAIMACYSVNSLAQGNNFPSIPREQIRTIIERDALSCLNLRDKWIGHRKKLPGPEDTTQTTVKDTTPKALPGEVDDLDETDQTQTVESTQERNA